MSRIRVVIASLVALVAIVGVVVDSGPAAASAKTATAKRAVKPTTILVKAREFHFTLSKTFIAKPGTVIFKVTNVGKEPHNFVFLSGINKGTQLILPKKTATLRLVFKKKGVYTYECTVGEHAEEGMLGTFKVK